MSDYRVKFTDKFVSIMLLYLFKNVFDFSTHLKVPTLFTVGHTSFLLLLEIGRYLLQVWS